MAQLFSSGTSPEYLKAMADAYAMYFPQQQTYNPQTQQTTTGTLTPEYQQALQQWYSQNGYSPVNAAPTAVVPQSVVGGLFEDLYPQTRGSGGGGSREPMGQAYAGPSTQSLAESLASAGINYANTPLGNLLPGAWLTGLLGNAYQDYRISDAARNGGPTGTYTGYAAFGDRPNNTMTEAQTMAAIAGTGGGPLSGEAFGGGGYNAGAEGGGINGMGNYSGQDNVGNRGDN